MTLKTKTTLFLVVIFLISFLIRIAFYKTTPLLWDEASLGYNAYSIINTGKDEYGQILPIIFKSFGDYKPGFYVYLAIPFIKFIGLNELSIRLPSILIGSLIPIFLFFLIKEINPKSHKIALLATIITTFNPYNIHFSRGAWETNILTFELILASFLFFKYINSQKSKFLFLSSLIFGTTLFTYQAGKMISLFLIIILVLINFKSINFKKIFLSFIIPLGIFSIPIIFGLFFNHNSNRLQVVSLFSYPQTNSEIQTIISETNQLDYQIFYNPIIYFSRSFISRYFNHFSPQFLTFVGDWQNARQSAPYIGVILYPSLFFLVLGVFFALTKSKLEKINLFFLCWLLVAPLPAAFTRDAVQSVRSMSFSIPLVYFISLGIFFILNKYQSKLLRLTIIFVYFISFWYYSDLYLNHMIIKNPIDFLYGYRQAMDYVIKNKDKFNKIYITDYYGQPYIFYLFYSSYPPQNYQKQAKLDNSYLDVGNVKSIDNINFETAQYSFIKDHPGTLGIFSQEEIYRQGIDQQPDFKNFIPLSPIGNISTFYAYENP
ncbi:MAG: glycosyltransferase family 39 protein [Candidatus Shapirobacteria bacterium]|nr:glycosyltransferase family 39 protein [Candidatus Shapirobacteria bacterium]